MIEITRILIVDDSVNLRQIIKRFLEPVFKGVILEAGDGGEAEQILQEQFLNGEPVDVVILDWMMPKVSGLEFLKNIRSTEPFKNPPEVIMLTAETYADQINACLKFGVSTYITKPFTAADIAKALFKIANQEGQ